MARKVKEVVITAEGRDQGKTFVITEMPADQAERWALRALLALQAAGVSLPDGFEAAGMAGVAFAGLSALNRIRYEDIAPLLQEMMGCVKYRHRPGQDAQPLAVGEECQVEEVATLLQLRAEVLELHTGFSLADKLRNTAPPQAQLSA